MGPKTKKGEKVDIAILRDGEPIILIECKSLGSILDAEKCSQLFRYFTVKPEVRIGILTNGQKYLFFSDLERQNVMDSKPFIQQSLKDLDTAYKNFFEKRSEFPKFKKRGFHDSFHYPQGFKLDEENSRIFLPKIGWVKYFNHRKIVGIPKNVTASQSCGNWYVSIQTEREVEEPVHDSDSEIGIDMGVAYFAAFSDGTFIESINIFKKYADKLASFQRKLAKKIKFSSNWKKLKFKIQKLHKKIADTRRDFLYKATSAISKNHALVVVEDLQVKNMSKSASGTIESPGRNVKAKSGLNKSILDQGWGEFVRQLGYKLVWLGGKLLKITPQYTSQKCSRCGYVSKDNRKMQACFKCMACGFEANADHNAALNILAAGHAVTACGSGKGSSVRDEAGTRLGCGSLSHCS